MSIHSSLPQPIWSEAEGDGTEGSLLVSRQPAHTRNRASQYTHMQVLRKNSVLH